MAMGSTGTVNVTPDMIKSALSAIEEYENTVKLLFSTLSSTMSELIPGNFSGNAAQGFRKFLMKISQSLQTRMTKVRECHR